MAQIRWTARALDELEAAATYIERDSPRVAEAFAARVFQETDRLTLFPRSGRVVPELNRGDIRELIVFSYRIIYQVTDEDVIRILTLHHGARLLDDLRLENPE